MIPTYQRSGERRVARTRRHEQPLRKKAMKRPKPLFVCAPRSLPAVKALCVKLLSEAHASMPFRCCAIAWLTRLSSCGYGLACCHARLPFASFLRLGLSLAEPDQLLPAVPWKDLWQWPAWLKPRHAYLLGYDEFPRAQIRRPVCWVICLRACPVLRVPEFGSRASHPPC